MIKTSYKKFMLPEKINQSNLEEIYQGVLSAHNRYRNNKLDIYFDLKHQKVVFENNSSTIFIFTMYEKYKNKKLNRIINNDKNEIIDEIVRLYKTASKKFIKETQYKIINNDFTIDDVIKSINHNYYIIDEIPTQNLVNLLIQSLYNVKNQNTHDLMYIDNVSNVLLNRTVHLPVNHLFSMACELYFSSDNLLKLLEKTKYFDLFYNNENNMFISYAHISSIQYIPYHEKLADYFFQNINEHRESVLALLKMGVDNKTLKEHNINEVNINIYNIENQNIQYLKNINQINIDYYISNDLSSERFNVGEDYRLLKPIYEQLFDFKNEIVFYLNQKNFEKKDLLYKLLFQSFLSSKSVHFTDSKNIFEFIQEHIKVKKVITNDSYK